MRLWRVLLFQLAAGCWWASVAFAADDAKQELEKLQGEWIVVSAEINGAAIAEAELQDLRRTVTGEEIIWKRGDDVVLRTRFKIDPSHSPKHWDVTFQDGDATGQTRLGIYELKGDELKICVAEPSAERPPEFATRQGAGGMLLVLKRAGGRD